MMIDFKSLIQKHNIQPRGVIQLGAHYWQEKEMFVSMGIKEFVLVEPQEHAFKVMYQKTHDVNALCFKYAVSDYDGYIEMYCEDANHGQSSSLLRPQKHIEKYPNIIFNHTESVEVVRIENIEFDRTKYNILVMDLQGNELKALLGAGDLLDYIDCIHTEVNFIEMYEGCVLIDELNDYLSEWGFQNVYTGQNTNNQGWSDAFYIKSN